MAPEMLPTNAELELLDILWERGPSTVREVHARLSREREVGYTTTLKLLQIMHEKGLVRRDTSERSHVYEAAVARERTQRALVQDLVERAFRGSALALVQRALSAERPSTRELAEIRRLLENMSERKR